MQTNLWDNQIAVKKIQIIYLTLSKYSLLSKKLFWTKAEYYQKNDCKLSTNRLKQNKY